MKGTFARRLRDTLLLPLVYAGAFVALAVLTCAVLLFFLWNSVYNPDNPSALAWFAGALRGAVLDVAPCSAVVAGALLLFRLVRRPGIRPVSLVFLVASVGALLYFGAYGARALASSREAPRNEANRPFFPDRLHLLRGAVVYVGAVNGASLRDVVVVRPGESAPVTSAAALDVGSATLPAPVPRTVMTFSPSASLDPAGLALRFGSSSIPVEPPNPSFGPLFAPPRFLADLAADVARFNEALAQEGSRDELLASALAAALLCVGGVLFAQLTAWPLLNAFLAALYFRALFLLYGLVESTGLLAPVERLAAGIAPAPYARFAPQAALGALGLLFILVNLAFFGRRGGEERADG